MNLIEIDEIYFKKVENKEDLFFLKLNGNSFYVGFLVIEILQLLEQRKNYTAISAALNEKYPGALFSEENIKHTVEIVFINSGILKKRRPEKNTDQYIFLKFTILKLQNRPLFLSVFKLLFTKRNFIVLFIASLLITVSFNLVTPHTVIQHSTINPGIIAASVLLYIAIIFFHEIGHGAASHFYNVVPKHIGFGFYIIYPVLYTDVTDIWQLPKNKRIVVNLAGVYFQMLFNVLLIILYYTVPALYFLKEMIFINSALAAVSANPFFRYDGYWVFSDFFEIPNLRKHSNNLRKLIIGKLFRRYAGYSWKDILAYKKSLLLYCIISNLFFGIFFFLFAKFGITAIWEIKQSLYNFLKLPEWNTLYPLLKGIILIGLMFYFILRSFKTNMLWTK